MERAYRVGHPPPWWWADQLAERGDLDWLRVRVDAGDVYAAVELADPLAKQGGLDEAAQIRDKAAQTLRAQANAGDGDATLLTVLSFKQGRGEEAERLRRFGLNPDGSTAQL